MDTKDRILEKEIVEGPDLDRATLLARAKYGPHAMLRYRSTHDHQGQWWITGKDGQLKLAGLSLVDLIVKLGGSAEPPPAPEETDVRGVKFFETEAEAYNGFLNNEQAAARLGVLPHSLSNTVARYGLPAEKIKVKGGKGFYTFRYDQDKIDAWKAAKGRRARRAERNGTATAVAAKAPSRGKRSPLLAPRRMGQTTSLYRVNGNAALRLLPRTGERLAALAGIGMDVVTFADRALSEALNTLASKL